MGESGQKSSQRTVPWIREMVEAVLGLGSVVGLSWWIPGPWRMSHLIFCAFFIVVFAIAIRYHMLVAYSASLFAAISYGLLLWLHPEMRVQPNFLYLALEPFLLLSSGIFASDILRWQRHRLNTLEQKYAYANETLQETYKQYQAVLTINEALEQQVAGQSTSVATMSDKMTHLWKLNGNERYSAILDIVIYAVEAQSCALYMQRNGFLHLSAARPIEGSLYPPVLNTNDPLVKRVIEQRKVSTIRDSLTQEKSVSREVAVMAGPLLDQAGKIMGIVIIDNMSLLKFTPGAVRLFSSILQMVSLSLQTARLAA